MRAEDLRPMELLSLDPKTGFPMMGSVRVFAVGAHVFGGLYEDLVRRLGEEAAVRLFTRFGYKSGLTQATNMADLYDWESDEQWLKAGSVLRNHLGPAREVLTDLELDREAGVLRLAGRWLESEEARGWLESEGTSPHPVCHMLAGMASGYASAVLGSEVLVQETACKAQGHEYCTFEGKPAAEWGLTPADLQKFFSLGTVEEEVGRLQDDLDQAKAALEASRAEVESLRRGAAGEEQEDHGLIFRSEAMEKVLQLASKVAPSPTTVLIQGETGTGKEMLARFLHQRSGRGEHPFMAINCAALPAGLLESELFGHVKGAFTGADRDQTGLFIQAGEGTLFLDEVGEMPLELQAKLLRALQEKEVRPVGGARTWPLKARLVAATNRDLRQRVAEGQFREDLFYRLAVIPMAVPPLRQRRQDILPLARHFLERFRPGGPGFRPNAVRVMESYGWPGNVRELENALEYAAVLAGDETITAEHLPLEVAGAAANPLGAITGDLPSEKDLIRRYTEMLLERTGHNKAEAARILGIGPNTLWRRMKAQQQEGR